MLAQGSQLAQIRPANTTATSAFTATIRTEITKIVISNTTASGVACRLFHDDSGSTFDQTTALIYDKTVPANDYIEFSSATEGGGIQVAIDGQIGVRTATNDALTFTIYGVTETLGHHQP